MLRFLFLFFITSLRFYFLNNRTIISHARSRLYYAPDEMKLTYLLDLVILFINWMDLSHYLTRYISHVYVFLNNSI